MALCACASVALPDTEKRPRLASAGGSSDALTLAARLPQSSLRCVVLQPNKLSARLRPLVAPVSQASELPWLLSMELSAYVAAEWEGPADSRELVELLRFVAGSQEQIRHELTRTDRRTLRWQDGVSMVCGDEPGCVEVEARFLGPHTVQLRSRTPASLESSTQRSCRSVLEQQPDVLEIAVRGGSALGGKRVETLSSLRADGDALLRVLRHRFQDEASAERAATRTLTGEEEAPTLGGSLVEASTAREGTWLVQRARVSFEELLLAAEDQQRLRQAVALVQDFDLGTPPAANDAEAVRRHYDAVLRSRDKLTSPGTLTALDLLLSEARQLQLDDDGLARRQYQLRLVYLRSPAGALEVAEQALAAGHGELAAWQLARRRALLTHDPKRFRAALQKSFGFPAQVARQMADEVERKVLAQGDYERAEWAFLTARSMCQRVERQGRSTPAAAPRLPLAELPRLLTYLARLSPEHEGDLGVHIVARGAQGPSARAEAPTWSEQTTACGEPGHVLAAASFDDAQLLAQGALLASQFPAGELELAVGIDPLGGAQPAQGATLRLRGTVEQGMLTVHELSRPLRDVRWPLVDRYLIAPLASLRGGLFPPDEWSFELPSIEQAMLALTAAQTEPSAQCERDGTRVRCRGSFTDARVAARALRRAAGSVLSREARALWSSAE